MSSKKSLSIHNQEEGQMADLWLTLVITCIIFGYAGNFYAKKTGRDPVRWTALGVFLNVFILGLMIVMGGRSQKVRQYIH